jgi:hypothetical protein
VKCLTAAYIYLLGGAEENVFLLVVDVLDGSSLGTSGGFDYVRVDPAVEVDLHKGEPLVPVACEEIFAGDGVFEGGDPVWEWVENDWNVTVHDFDLV